jgi:hypothetical protein
MKYFRFLLIFVVSVYTTQIIAQEKFTWKGYVKDSLSGETLINASIIINNETHGVATNQYGYFSLIFLRLSLSISMKIFQKVFCLYLFPVP